MTRLQDVGNEGPYYQAIGTFIVAYAQCECTVHELARKLSGLKDEKARILFAGMRIGDLTTRLRGLLHVSRWSNTTKKDIEDCLKQLDVVGLERDKMVHRYSNYEMGSITFSNEMTAKSMLSAEKDSFSMNDLTRLERDCLAINLRLTHVLRPTFRKIARLDPESLKRLHGSWWYKRFPQSQKKKRTRQRIAKALLHQQQSSRQ